MDYEDWLWCVERNTYASRAHPLITVVFYDSFRLRAFLDNTFLCVLQGCMRSLIVSFALRLDRYFTNRLIMIYCVFEFAVIRHQGIDFK